MKKDFFVTVYCWWFLLAFIESDVCFFKTDKSTSVFLSVKLLPFLDKSDSVTKLRDLECIFSYNWVTHFWGARFSAIQSLKNMVNSRINFEIEVFWYTQGCERYTCAVVFVLTNTTRTGGFIFPIPKIKNIENLFNSIKFIVLQLKWLNGRLSKNNKTCISIWVVTLR